MRLVGWADLSDDSANDHSADDYFATARYVEAADIHRTARYLGTDDTAAANRGADASAGRDPAPAPAGQAGRHCAAADPGRVAPSSRAAAGAT
ncbi:hypothetical protein [Nocardia altamirensis]|uniref:hypothetical protein n=1 Tax=Nocardia altamirensis TaxID=472158 RepID=UPI00084013D6|nr:hypothetical protein [Nocardia altamirensis]